MFSPFCLFPPARCLQPQPWAPVQGLDLTLELQETSGNALGHPSRVPACRQGSPAPLARPFMSCPHFISQEPQHFFSTEMVFLEPVSKAALRGTADAATALARPGPEVRVCSTPGQPPSLECLPAGCLIPLELTGLVPPEPSAV